MYSGVTIARPPRTWANGDYVLPSRLRKDPGNAITLLTNPTAFSGIQQTAQSLTANTWTAVNLDTEVWDPYQQHSSVTYPAYYYLCYNQGAPGWYLAKGRAATSYSTSGQAFSAGIGFAAAGGTSVTWYGGETTNTTGGRCVTSVAKLVPLITPGTLGGSNGDRLALGAKATVASTLQVAAGGAYPQFDLRWLGIGDTNPWGVLPPAPTYASPPSPITSAWLNTVRDDIRGLTWPPFMERAVASTVSIASASAPPTVGALIDLGTTVDNWGMYSGGTSLATIPAGWGGTFWCYGQVAYAAASYTGVGAGLTVTSPNYNSGSPATLWGNMQNPGSNGVVISSVQRRLRLNAGDTIGLSGWQLSSGTQNLYQAGCWLILSWEGL
jgi:hypothetical protein